MAVHFVHPQVGSNSALYVLEHCAFGVRLTQITSDVHRIPAMMANNGGVFAFQQNQNQPQQNQPQLPMPVPAPPVQPAAGPIPEEEAICRENELFQLG